MGSSVLKATLLKTGIAACVLFLASGLAMADSAVTLTAGPTTTTLPDGQVVPMWGYTCGALPTNATCTAANGVAQTGTTWQPPVITVPSGAPLTITLINNLSFTAGTGTNTVPTSIVIVGQLGGGLGGSPTRMDPVTHAAQGTTWPLTPGGTDTGAGDAVFTPPAQAQRVRSFATEVAAAGATLLPGQVASGSDLTWANPRPGTYLIHSGTQPSIQHPMGLYGVLVVTDVAYPGVTFDKDVALLLSEIDPVQNNAVNLAVRTAGFTDTPTWSGQIVNGVKQCGHADVHTCYPPAVNYQPLYFLVNGVSFDRTNAAASALTVPAVPATPAAAGRVLLRFVNAGLRMHVPSVVGSNMTLLAEDGNKLPGLARVQSSLFLAAGKTYDVTIQPKAASGSYAAATYAVFDRALGLSANNQRDGGMQAYINVAGGSASATAAAGTAGASATVATANPDSYFVISGTALTVGDPAKGVIANDVGIYGVAVSGAAPAGLVLSPNGTFTYAGSPTSFTYCGNGATTGAACATVTLAACTTTPDINGKVCLGGTPTANGDSYTSNVASRTQVSSPGVLANDTDPLNLRLCAAPTGATSCPTTPQTVAATGGSVTLNPDGSFVATPTAPPTGTGTATVSFSYRAINSHNQFATATAAVTFGGGSGLIVAVKNGKTGAATDDYRWIIEEDRTVYIDPKCQVNTGGNPRPLDSFGVQCPPMPVQSLATNFHTSHAPVVAQGCVGTISCEDGQTLLGVKAVCDVGNGACRTTATKKTEVLPGQVHLDPTKRYYLSVLPGDGSTMSGAQIGKLPSGSSVYPAVDVFVQATPLEPAKIAVFVFQDDSPLNGESDTGGGVDILAPNEPGLEGFNIVLLDQAGAMGDSSGQLTYDMFGQPVSNSLAGTKDPRTGLDACPISNTRTDGLVGMIVTCPKYMSDGTTLSPLRGHAVIANMYPGLYEVVATAGADRIARGEEWLQTNTLDGTKAIEAFIKAGEPGYFQEFGPGGYHVAVGFANPKIINDRKAAICAATGSCPGNFYGQVTATRMSRTPDARVYSSGSYDAYSFTNCYVSLGAPDSDDFAFTKCDENGKFEFVGIPTGNLRVTVFDQYNDLLVDGLSTPIKAASTGLGSSAATRMEIPVTQWRTNLYGRVYLDTNGDGVSQPDEPGLPLVPYNIRYRDGSYAGFNNTDLNGYAGFNEVFPFLNWLVVDIDNARHKLTGVHVVHDAGGQVDPSDNTSAEAAACATGPNASCGNSTIAAGYANTRESPTAHLPTALRVPGARYCATADCALTDPGFDPASGNPGSTGRVDPPWASTQGWQGLLGQSSFVEFGMKPFAAGENGGIKGHVLYTPTRPFDDPALLLQLSWAPGVADVKVNLYRQDTAADGTNTLKLVDTTTSSSWDAWAQGFRTNPDGTPYLGPDGKAVANMNCPGQETSSPFYFTLQGSAQWLNPTTPLSSDSRFKCYDGWSMLNQVQPAPYNGMYKFPSVAGINPATGKPAGTNCTDCTTNPDTTDPYAFGLPMLRAGKYVVEVIVPTGYELVKEEDKNILLGDTFIAPAVQQFPDGFGAIFIMPDQAAVNAFYNPTNSLQRTTNNGAVPRREGDTGSVEVFWPCVGEKRIVPDLNSLFPGAGQQAPFAGATRPLCDRKEITLTDQMTALAKFYIFSSTHVASHFTGTITNDFASEFDPFSPQFGEKFGVPNTPVALRDFSGKEVSRVYSDQWGLYNGLNFSTFTVNPPSPSGYVPQMMIACMNDPGPIPNPADPTGLKIIDPAYNPAYSNFCYEIPFMPGQTSHLDTPVIPTMAFAAGYNLPDCEYPDATPAIKSVTSSDGAGPWVIASGAGHTLTITALGTKDVLNHKYSGPQATTSPFNQKRITRRYSFGTTAGAVAIVGADGVAHDLTSVIWGDTTITGTVPGGVPLCSASNPTYKGANASARCGELVITAANGKKSVDTVSVTIGGTAPIYVTSASTSVSTFGHIQPNPLQTAIDQAAPGALIIVAPGEYKENVLMWKPVRLQGVGAESVIINADAHPAGKLEAWRRQVDCLFGLAINGQPNTDNRAASASFVNPFDSTGAGYTCPAGMEQQVDRIPNESILGWDATGNGNLAQMLQEPTLMGAYEGAGITVLGKGVWIPDGLPLTDQFGGAATGNASAGGFPLGYEYLTDGSSVNGSTVRDYCGSAGGTSVGRDFGTSNFLCNPSRIDGISFINSSQGGGAIFAHAWNHHLEVANTRVHGNHGTLTGGITIGNGEFPNAFLIADDTTPPPPGMVLDVVIPGLANQQNGYGFNRHVKVHHNAVTSNASLGDALYSGTPSGAGGVTFCAGADNYQFDSNWICGNLSTGDGGGVSHSGFINNGTISKNTIIFNQSQSATIPTHGGGLGVLGASPDRSIVLANGAVAECGSFTDLDCPPGLPEGTGRNLLIDANLIMGNSAESGTGGGVRLQMVNGQDVADFPRDSRVWNDVKITNNVIANNVAGWDGGGVSMQDALKLKFNNNTVTLNDTTASAGVLFNTLGAPFASVPPPGCTPATASDATCPRTTTTSTNQPAGLVTMGNTPNLTAAIAAVTPTLLGVRVICPPGYDYSGLLGVNGNCQQISLPLMYNNVFWKNRAFHVEVGPLGSPTLGQNQQSVVTLVPVLNQTTTGQIVETGTPDIAPGSGNPAAYWDIGVRGDTTPTANSGSGFTLVPRFSILSVTGTSYTGNSNRVGFDPAFVNPFANGARIPPERCAGVTDPIELQACKGYQAPAGHSEFTGLAPVFALNQITVAATVDEGNNWINLGYGPLALFSANAEAMLAATPQGPALGAYSVLGTSPAINFGSNTVNIPLLAQYTPSTGHDFFGTSRPQGSTVEIGAVEFVPPNIPIPLVTPGTLAFGTLVVGTTPSPTQTLTLVNNGGVAFTGIVIGALSPPFSRTTTCLATLAPSGSCTITVTFTPTTPTSGVPIAFTGSLTITGNVAVTNAPVALTGTGVAAIRTATVVGGPLAFGNWATGTSDTKDLTLTNTGNLGLPIAVGAFPASFSRNTGGTFPTGAPNCPATLAAGAACTIRVQFAPASGSLTGIAFSGSLAIASAGWTITGQPVALSGTGVLFAVNPTPLAFGNVVVGTTSASQTLTVRNATGATRALTTIFVTAPFSRVAGGCGTTLANNSSCTITVTFTPTTTGPASGSATITSTGFTVFNSPVPLSGNGVAAIRTATVAQTSLAFGNWATGTTSSTQNVTVTNTGNIGLAGGSFTTGAPFSRNTGGTFPAGAPNCAATLAVGASCTVKVQFAPTAVTSFSGSLAVAYTGATVTNPSVTLTGTGVATRATVSITPNPLTITLATGVATDIGTVTLTNTAPVGTGANMAVSSVSTSTTGGGLLSFFFSNGALAGPDSCTGATVAPGASCSVTVRFTNVNVFPPAPRGVIRNGTITFTDNAQPTPSQSGALIGFATP